MTVQAHNVVHYKSTRTGWKAHQSSKFVRGLMGPVGSGKSVWCCWEIFKRAQEQRPSPDDVARTRWAVVRNTYRELEDTTIKTWLDWFSEDVFGPINKRTMTHVLTMRDDDGKVTHEVEVLFRALDKPSDIKKLLSMELTGAWLNEAREIPLVIKDALETRLGRYPAKRDGGPTWHGLIMDTNPPDDDHWWYELAEENTPINHEFFRQPSGMSPKAENVENLPDGYYENLSLKGEDFVSVYVHGEYGYVQDGKPVHPDYADRLHLWESEINFDSRLPLIVGFDFGITPAAVFLQPMTNGGYAVIDEYVDDNLSTAKFGQAIKRIMGSRMIGAQYEGWGDPAGDSRSAGNKDLNDAFEIMGAEGVIIAPTYTNSIVKRVAAVDQCLTTIHDQRPRLILSPRCKTLRKALAGKYQYRRINIGGGERFHDKPDKNEYSHVADALQYALLGAGENASVSNRHRGRTKTVSSLRRRA